MEWSEILMNWALFGVSQALLGASIVFMYKGKMPPPFTHKKATPIMATATLVVGLTMMIVFGTEGLLEATIIKLTR